VFTAELNLAHDLNGQFSAGVQASLIDLALDLSVLSGSQHS